MYAGVLWRLFVCLFIYFRQLKHPQYKHPHLVIYIFVFSFACQRDWSCTRIPLQHVWKIDTTFFWVKTFQSPPSPPPPPFFRAGAASWPVFNLKPPPLKKILCMLTMLIVWCILSFSMFSWFICSQVVYIEGRGGGAQSGSLPPLVYKMGANCPPSPLG